VTVASVGELIDRGIKLYMAGRVPEAREAFQLALDADPGNPRARAYLVHIREAPPAPAVIVPPAPAEEPVEMVALPEDEHVAVAAPATPARVPAAQPPAPRAASAQGSTPAPAPAAPAGRVALPAAADGPRAAVAEEPHDEEYAPSPWDDGPAAPATIELDSSLDGLDLEAVADKSDLRPLVPEGARAPPASASGPPSDVEVWLAAAKELFSLGDFSGSLELIEKILQLDPDHGEARDYLRQNESTLVSMYESKLGPLTHIPRLAIKPEEVMWLNLDHRAGFLLAQIDGTVDYDTLFALSGLPRLDTARILANLIADGVITS
jgi:tetratricopeptide (TPR) repeat protein